MNYLLKLAVASTIVFFLTTCTVFSQITINEWMADNANALSDEAGEFDDWFELYNTGDSPVDLQGYYLSDDPLEPEKFLITNSTVIEADSFLIFWADDELDQGPTHVNFKLGSGGESIVLSDANLVEIDAVTFGAQTEDVSTGAFPDGSSIYFTFINYTPGGANDNSGVAAGFVKPEFNLTGGFYSSTQYVELTHPDNTVNIHYTLNGDAPDDNDAIYNGPIEVSATTVIRAVATKPQSPLGRIASNIYYINQTYSIPTISVIGDPDDFFGSENGIYANPEEEGAEWERFTQVHYFEEEELKFEVDCGIRIQGSSSVILPKKSFRLFFESSYGQKWLEYPLFPESEVDRFRNLVLRSGYDDSLDGQGTLLRDPFGSDKYDDSGGLVSDRSWAILTINGEYWGIYDIRESVNNHFIKAHTGYNDFDLIRLGKFEAEAKEGDLVDWNIFTDFLNNNDLSIQENYEQVKEMLDVENFANFMAFVQNIAYNSWTWGASAYKEKKPGAKWKFTIWDLDRSLSSKSYEGFEAINDTDGILWGNFIPKSLLENDEFKSLMLNRVADVLNTSFTSDQARADFDFVKNEIAAEIPKEIDRWPGISVSKWYENTDYIDNYLMVRPQIIRDEAVDVYSLNGINEIVLDKTGEGKIQLNTLTLDSFPWSGEYFDGIPVHITAQPAPGYVFSGWSDTDLPQTPSLVLDFSNIKNLTAFFTQGNTDLHQIVINEINYNAAPDSNSGDWIEIYNAGLTAADISGWYLQDESGDYFNIPNATTLGAGEYLVLAEDLDLFQNQYPGVTNVVGGFGNQATLSFGLSNAGEFININNADQSFQDSVDYNDKLPWPIEPDGNGPSLQLIATNLDNYQAINWAAAPATPGWQNFGNLQLPQQISFPEINDHFALDDPFVISASSTSGLDVLFQVVSGPATVSGNTITLDGVSGTVVIAANQSGSASWLPATTITQSFEVLKEVQAINYEEIQDQLPSTGSVNIMASSDANLSLNINLVSGPVSLDGMTLNFTGAVGTVVLEISQPGNATFLPAEEVTLSFEIYQLEQLISIENITDKFTLDPNFEVIASVDSELPLSFEITEGPATIVGNEISLDGVQGSVTVRVFQNGDIDHIANENFASFDVLLTAQDLVFEEIDNHVESDDPFEVLATTNAGTNISYAIVSGPASIDGNTISLGMGTGTVEVKAEAEGNDTYAPATVTESFIVSEAVLLDQEITWTAIEDKFTIDDPFQIIATASSGLEVTYSISQGPATILGNTITLDGVIGTVKVIASQSGDVLYYPANDVEITFEVIKQDQSITWTAIEDKFTTDDPFEILAMATSGLGVSYAVESGPATLEGNLLTLGGTVGTVNLIASQSGDQDYNAAAEVGISFEVKLSSNSIDFIDQDLVLFPNPTSGFVQIQSSNLSLSTIIIMNMQGSILYRQKIGLNNSSQYFDVTSFPAGTYFVELRTIQGTRLMKRLVKI